jgi:LysR family transcriptional regulator, transcriptional activator of the cysJI operon
MNDRHLKIFLTVCEVGNMTRAAKELFMAQPSVSQAVAELEKYYGVRLFERLNHRLYITPAGERLRSYARHILNLSEQARQELADLGQSGAVRIGASLTIGAYLLPGLVSAFHQHVPEVEVFTRVDNTSLIEKLLLEDQLDLGLVEGPVHSPHIVEEAYCDDSLVFIAAPQHPLALKQKLRVQDLAGQAFIMRESGSGTQEIFEHAMHAAEVGWKTSGVYNNNEALKQAVHANLGLAVVSKIAVAEEIQQKKLVTLEIEGLALKRKFNLIYHRQKYFTQAMQLFWDVSYSALGSKEVHPE